MFHVTKESPCIRDIQAGGRQVKVAPAPRSSSMEEPAEAGKQVIFDQVLFWRRWWRAESGRPFLSGAKVIGVVDGESRGPKVRVFKKSVGRDSASKRARAFSRNTHHRYSGIAISRELKQGHKKGQGSSRNGATATRSGSASSVTTATS